MGYYSEVAITMGHENFDAMMGHFRAKKDAETFALIQCADIYVNEDYNAVTIFWRDIKWYELISTPCGTLMKYLHSKDVPFYFLRVGEEFDDMECYAEGDGAWDYADIVQISRYVEFLSSPNLMDRKELTYE